VFIFARIIYIAFYGIIALRCEELQRD